MACSERMTFWGRALPKLIHFVRHDLRTQKKFKGRERERERGKKKTLFGTKASAGANLIKLQIDLDSVSGSKKAASTDLNIEECRAVL